MKILVWQWGRRGAGPRFAACLAEALRTRPCTEISLSLSRGAEIMAGPNPPACDLPVVTYRGKLSFVVRLASAPLLLPALLRRLRRIQPDLAICAMPGPLDLLMLTALRLLGARIVVVVHEAEAHPGDGFPLQMALQRLLCRRADGLAALSRHVAAQLRQQRLVGAHRPLIPFSHPPFGFDLPPVAADPACRPKRLLFFGRLLPYKGLSILAAALAALPADTRILVRVVGLGPDSPDLDALRACPGVSVENRWVPETEIGALIGWSDALILPYREASQSGIAAVALAAGRPVIATRVGGLREQLAGAPLAVLCEPDATSLSRAISLWLEIPATPPEPADAAAAWRAAGASLMAEISAALPAPQARQRGLPGWSVGAKPNRMA